MGGGNVGSVRHAVPSVSACFFIHSSMGVCARSPLIDLPSEDAKQTPVERAGGQEGSQAGSQASAGAERNATRRRTQCPAPPAWSHSVSSCRRAVVVMSAPGAATPALPPREFSVTAHQGGSSEFVRSEAAILEGVAKQV